MKIFIAFALFACACAAEVKEKEDKSEPELNKDKRQTQGEFVPSLPTHLLYRSSRKQDPVAPVDEPQEDDRLLISSRADVDQYRPGQVFSLNPRELLELQQERKSPLSGSQQLQQIYSSPQQDQRQNLQQIYYLEPQTARQVGIQSTSPSTVAPLSYQQQQYQQPQYQQSLTPQQSLQQLILQAFGGQQVGAPNVAPPSNSAPPLPGNPTSHQLSNYPQQDRTEYLRELINLQALLNNQNLALPAPSQYSAYSPNRQNVASFAPPQYSTATPNTQNFLAPSQYSTPDPQLRNSLAPSQYSTVAPNLQNFLAPSQYSTVSPNLRISPAPSQYSTPAPILRNSLAPSQYSTVSPINQNSLAPSQYSTVAPNFKNVASFAPPQYSTIAPNRQNAASPAPFQYSTVATYTDSQTERPQQAQQTDNSQIEKQPLYYVQGPGGQVFASNAPYDIAEPQQLNRNAQPQQSGRPDLQQLLLLQALAQTTPRSEPSPAQSLFTRTRPSQQNYQDSQQDDQQRTVLIGATGRSLRQKTTPSPLLDTTPIPSNQQLQELDSTEPAGLKLKQINLVNALQEQQSLVRQNTSRNGAFPNITPRVQVDDVKSTSNSLTKDEQVASHAVIARPHYSSNGGEASVGAALSVSDTGVNPSDSFDQELLALLGQPNVRPDAQIYQQQTASVAPQYQQVQQSQTAAPQYQQIDRYITKPSKKPTRLRPKVHSHVSPPQSSAAPQQYLIETTNVQQQPQPQQSQYRPAPQPQRVPQALRYTPAPTSPAYLQQALYERPESQGLKVVAAPKLQQAQPQPEYRLLQTYQQPEATPKQYRILDATRGQAGRPEQRIPASSIDRPVTYLKRYPEEKMRAVKIYDPVPQDRPQQSAQLLGDQYYLRPVYRPNELRDRYQPSARPEQQRVQETPKPAHSAIYVSKNLAPKKVKSQSQPPKAEPSSSEQSEEQRGQSIEERRAQLPPPKNNRAYTPEEFAALVAAGYSVTPIPVAPLGHPGHPVHPVAQSRSSAENASAPVPAPSQRRPNFSRRHQRLHLSGDDAP